MHDLHQHTIDGAAASLEGFELRYCFLCDADAPHLSTLVAGEYVFQCGSCFAAHVEPVPAAVLGPGTGRHRAA